MISRAQPTSIGKNPIGVFLFRYRQHVYQINVSLSLIARSLRWLGKLALLVINIAIKTIVLFDCLAARSAWLYRNKPFTTNRGGKNDQAGGQGHLWYPRSIIAKHQNEQSSFYL